MIARVTVDQIDDTSDSCVLHLTVLRRLYRRTARKAAIQLINTVKKHH